MNPTAMNPTESIERHPFEELADEFVLKLRSGQSPSIEHYAQAYPEHAAMIRSVFPSLMIVEKVSAKVTNESISPTLWCNPAADSASRRKRSRLRGLAEACAWMTFNATLRCSG